MRGSGSFAAATTAAQPPIVGRGSESRLYGKLDLASIPTWVSEARYEIAIARSCDGDSYRASDTHVGMLAKSNFP